MWTGIDFTSERARLIENLATEIHDCRVLRAMSCIPRELFVPAEMRHAAYEDRPLPIGFGQTISQPFIVALMTAALDLKGNEKILEIGTGSGYHTAILAELAAKVVTIERIPFLAKSALDKLKLLAYNNIESHTAEDVLGWQQDAPYDAIVVTAAAPSFPSDLIDQLVTGGRLVIPVGSHYLQELYKVVKEKGKNTISRLCGCRFVSLIGKGAWEEDNNN